MDVPAPADRAPLTLTVGGIPRRRALLIGIPLAVVLAVGSALAAWLANVEPLGFNGGMISVRPRSLVTAEFDAVSPYGGGGFTQYRVSLPPGERFRFAVTLTNDSPFPVTVTGAGSGATSWGPRILGARMQAHMADAPPPAPLPYTIPPHGKADLIAEVAFQGCLDEITSTFVTSVPASFRLFGVIERRTEITLPISIEIMGAPGTRCP